MIPAEKKSYIWEYGSEIVHVGKKTRHYYCRLCLDDKKVKYKPLVLNGTSVNTHFRKKHPAEYNGKDPSMVGTATSSLAWQAEPSEPMLKKTLEAFKLLLIKWIVYCHIAFIQIENIYFRDVISFLSPSLAKCLPSRNTFRRWVIAEFRKQKRKVKKGLKRARSNIHLSFDLWTSPNSYAIIAIVAHYIDEKGCRQTKLLAIRRLEGEHSGENIASAVLRVIKEYRIRNRVGFFILDNASSNDVAVDIILSKLYRDMDEKARKRRRLRCLAHVTNLVAKAFLMGPKGEEMTDELLLAQHHEDSERATRAWRKHGALGKLQNLIRYHHSAGKISSVVTWIPTAGKNSTSSK